MFVDLDYYFNTYNGQILQNNDQSIKELNNAERQINIICNSVISNGTIHYKSQYVIDIIKYIICEQADFNYKNSDLINSTLKKYAINGVSIEYETNQQIKTVRGIFIKQILYEELAYHGLIYRGI